MKQIRFFCRYILITYVTVWSVFGCQRTELSRPANLDQVSHPDPAVRLRAFRWAGQQRIEAAVPILVEALNDQEPAIRFGAIQALEEITGETLGYHYKDKEPLRSEAIQRWRDLLQKQEQQSDSNE